MLKVLYIFLSLWLALLAGCVSQPVSLFQLPPAHVIQLPLVAGVYYSDEFRAGKYGTYEEEETGRANVNLFNTVLRETFQQVIELRSRPPLGGDTTFDLILMPRMSGLTYRAISYDVVIADSNGEKVGTFYFTAVGSRNRAPGEPVTRSELRQAAAQLLVGLRARSEITSRLSSFPVQREAPPRKYEPGIAILSTDATPRYFLKCMHEYLNELGTPGRFVERDLFIDGLFPWFEESVLPRKLEELRQRAQDHQIASSAANIGVRYVVLVHGQTYEEATTGPFECMGGPLVPPHCLGVQTSTRHSTLKVFVGDFGRGEAREVQASASGTSTVIGVLVPIPIIAATQSQVCRQSAADVARLMDFR